MKPLLRKSIPRPLSKSARPIDTTSLRGKISSAVDLKSIVRTMKALAASSIGLYEKSVRSLTDYYRTVELGLGVCFRESGLTPRPFNDVVPASFTQTKVQLIAALRAAGYEVEDFGVHELVGQSMIN